MKKLLFVLLIAMSLTAHSQSSMGIWGNVVNTEDGNRDLNRLKVVLADKKRTNKWLAEQLGKDPATISKWCTNTCQPDLGNLMRIAQLLEVDVNELLRFFN